MNRVLFSTFVALVGAVSIWESSSLLISNPKLLPPIRTILSESLSSFSRFGDTDDVSLLHGASIIGQHTLKTLTRIVVGSTIGIAIGLVFAVPSLWGQKGRVMASRFVALIRNIPLLALIPLFVFWFGGKEIGIVSWIAFACSVVMATGAASFVDNVNQNHIALCQMSGGSRWQIFADVIVPSITPDLTNSYRAMMGLSWAFALGGEYLVARSGLGFLTSQSYMYSDMGKLLVLILWYGVLGVATYLVTGFLYGYLCPWKKINRGI